MMDLEFFACPTSEIFDGSNSNASFDQFSFRISKSLSNSYLGYHLDYVF
jgi:hypothetical protein